MVSIMRGKYPSGGVNIGPALTFGYIAGRDLAQVTDYEVTTTGLEASSTADTVR